MTIVRKESKRDPALRWFDEARFGMFIHYGIYALLGRGEWVMYRGDIKREDYVKLVPQFNPERFDADEWVAVAADAAQRRLRWTSPTR